MQAALSKESLSLHSLSKLGDFRYSRAELQETVRDNFLVADRWIQETPKEHRALVQRALVARCAAA
jgi:hypothetical protein